MCTCDGKGKGKKGFTLVEILVVVAIIGLLSSVFVIGLSGVRSRGRDTKRLADIKQVQNAMELYYAKCGYYPGGVDGTGNCNTTDPTTWGGLSTTLTTAGIGVAKIPVDPTVGKTYYYAFDTARQSYILAAILENAKDPTLTGSAYTTDVPGVGWSKTDTGTFPACSAATTYCVKF